MPLALRLMAVVCGAQLRVALAQELVRLHQGLTRLRKLHFAQRKLLGQCRDFTETGLERFFRRRLGPLQIAQLCLGLGQRLLKLGACFRVSTLLLVPVVAGIEQSLGRLLGFQLALAQSALRLRQVILKPRKFLLMRGAFLRQLPR